MFPQSAIVSALMLHALAAGAGRPPDRVGDKYEITLESISKTSADDGSSSSSNSRDTLIEKVIAVRNDGIELEFDLPEDTTSEERADIWQFPVRVLKPEGRPFELLNRKQLEIRIQSWLNRRDIPKELCGHWIFTWNAFKIECDPASVLDALQPFDLRLSNIREGALYREPDALEPVPLRADIASSGRSILVAEMMINPVAIRRARAEQDVILAEIMAEESVTFETALRKQVADRISGAIATTFEKDAAGRITRRTRVTDIKTVAEDNVKVQQIFTQITTRNLLQNPD